MPTYIFEVYEIGTAQYKVDGNNLKDAMDKFHRNGGEMVDNTNEFMEFQNQSLSVNEILDNSGITNPKDRKKIKKELGGVETGAIRAIIKQDAEE